MEFEMVKPEYLRVVRPDKRRPLPWIEAAGWLLLALEMAHEVAGLWPSAGWWAAAGAAALPLAAAAAASWSGGPREGAIALHREVARAVDKAPIGKGEGRPPDGAIAWAVFPLAVLVLAVPASFFVCLLWRACLFLGGGVPSGPIAGRWLLWAALGMDRLAGAFLIAAVSASFCFPGTALLARLFGERRAAGWVLLARVVRALPLIVLFEAPNLIFLMAWWPVIHLGPLGAVHMPLFRGEPLLDRETAAGLRHFFLGRVN
jgi:hypothetical protein